MKPPKARSLAAIYVSVFILAALGYVFANAWNNFVLAFMDKHSKKDKDGNIIKPVDHLLYYSIGISVLCAVVLWFIYEYIKFDITKKVM